MTVLESVRKIISREWLPAFKVRTELKKSGHRFMSESATTARIRDLRKRGIQVDCRKNGRYYEYHCPS